ncbi:MAG: hypothetical protein LBI82_12835 [Dysgonamonadaceae bacterium]|jgi:hypothetical protein|nr:hypothetical protein [Dysgonamonadaceae bacterium]
MKIKLSLSVLLLTFSSTVLLAQNVTNSPYSLYGYGELSDPAFGAQKAMGGIGYGLREGNIINPLNPASFSRVDSMTFMFDAAITAKRSWFDDGINTSQNTNAKLDYIAMQFPLAKNLGMGLGFKPITQVGYKFGKTYPDSIMTNTGSGGLNQFYGALSYNFKNLSVGVNAGYLFGNIYHQQNVTFNNSAPFPAMKSDTLSASGLILNFGLQYTRLFGKDQRIVLGAVYTPKLSINGKFSGAEFSYNSSGVIQGWTPRPPRGEGYELPETYAVGFSYAKGERFLGGIDCSYQRWSDVKFEGETGQFNDRTKINIGGEYTPNIRSRAYFKRVHYRLGGNFANSYVSPIAAFDGKPYPFNEYSVSCGFGFPLIDKRSAVNLAFEYTKIRPNENVVGLVREQYLRLTVSYTFNELWFFQRKVQ